MSSKFIDAHQAAQWVASGDTVCTVAGKTVIDGECLMMPPVRPKA